MRKAAAPARWTAFLLISSVVANHGFRKPISPVQPKFKEQALAEWATSFRTLLKRSDKSPFQTRLFSIEKAITYAQRLHSTDPLSKNYIPGNWKEVEAAVQLMNFPQDLLLNEFNRLSPQDPNYHYIVTALARNYNLAFYPQIQAAYEFEPNDQKKRDLADILLNIQYNAIIVSQINRRTWRERYAGMDDRFLQAVRQVKAKYPDGILITDWGISNAMTTFRRVRRLENENLLNGVHIKGYDKVIHFQILDRDSAIYIFNSEGKLIQYVTANNRLWIRWTLAQYLPSPIQWVFYWAMNHVGGVHVGDRARPKDIAYFEKFFYWPSESVSLLDPEAEAWARDHPQNLQFAHGDITAPTLTERPHIILMTGVAMRPEKYTFKELVGLLSKRENYSLTQLVKIFWKTGSYFTEKEVRELLVRHGQLLQEGGFLFNGIDVPPHLYLDIYEKKRANSYDYHNLYGLKVTLIAKDGM